MPDSSLREHPDASPYIFDFHSIMHANVLYRVTLYNFTQHFYMFFACCYGSHGTPHAVAHIISDVTLGYGAFRLSKHRAPLPGRTQPRLIRPWLVSARLGCCSASQLSRLLFSCLSCFCLLLLRTSCKWRTRVCGDVHGWWLRRLSAFIV